MHAMHLKAGHGRRQVLNKRNSEINSEHSYYSLAGGLSFLLSLLSLFHPLASNKGKWVREREWKREIVLMEMLHKWHSCWGFRIKPWIYIMSDSYNKWRQIKFWTQKSYPKVVVIQLLKWTSWLYYNRFGMCCCCCCCCNSLFSNTDSRVGYKRKTSNQIIK